MEFGITYDANRDARIQEIILGANTALRQYFANRFYDDSGIGFFVVLMCRDPQLNFKQRIRYSKKDNIIYLDIMLELQMMKEVNLKRGREIVAEKILEEIPRIVLKYKLTAFDLKRFLTDLRKWFFLNSWLERDARNNL